MTLTLCDDITQDLPPSQELVFYTIVNLQVLHWSPSPCVASMLPPEGHNSVLDSSTHLQSTVVNTGMHYARRNRALIAAYPRTLIQTAWQMGSEAAHVLARGTPDVV